MEYKFDAEATKNRLIEWIRDWFKANGPECKAVVGISGGKDSSIVAKLCVEALGVDRVIGIMMPNHKQSDIADSHALCDLLGIENYVVDVGVAVEPLLNNIKECVGLEEFTPQSMTNLPPRIRMSTLYAISQSKNGRVVNTSNASERFIGWGTMYGDCAGDMSPLGNLTVTEVRAVGHALGLPSELVDKKPADGLTGRTDEDNLGFTYAVLDKYIRTGVCEDAEIKANIDRRHAGSAFKRNGMVIFEP